MSHIFISYSKKNADYANHLANFLREQGFDIWIDQIRIEYGVNWWLSIVEGLRECGAFIVIMTPEAYQSEWVQNEVFIALDKRKAVFPVLLNGENWELFVLTQFVDVRDGSLPNGEFVERLSQHVTLRRDYGTNQSHLTPANEADYLPDDDSFDMFATVGRFFAVYEKQQWADALDILGQIRASERDLAAFNPDNFEQMVNEAIETENKQREYERFLVERDQEYNILRMMLKHAPDDVVYDNFKRFSAHFADYDPDNLAELRPMTVHLPTKRTLEILPEPFEWLKIPAGQVTLTDTDGGYLKKETTFDVAPFMMAKYPVTVAQYAAFSGQDYDIQKANHPVVNVSWFSAIKFCEWLSVKTNANITLPSEQQWQFAAQSHDSRKYP